MDLQMFTILIRYPIEVLHYCLAFPNLLTGARGVLGEEGQEVHHPTTPQPHQTVHWEQQQLSIPLAVLRRQSWRCSPPPAAPPMWDKLRPRWWHRRKPGLCPHPSLNSPSSPRQPQQQQLRQPACRPFLRPCCLLNSCLNASSSLWCLRWQRCPRGAGRSRPQL